MFKKRQRVGVSLLIILFLVGCTHALEQVPINEAYRSPPYHAVTTKMPPVGVDRLSAVDLKELLAADIRPVLIDVYGAIFREESLYFDGAWLVSSPRENIPGSVWLPNVGKQLLKPVVKHYFDIHLIELTGGDKSKALVFYCIEDCWMSWNAAKRAHEWGYLNVMWFREGVDGWKDINGQLQASEPVNLPVDE